MGRDTPHPCRPGRDSRAGAFAAAVLACLCALPLAAQDDTFRSMLDDIARLQARVDRLAAERRKPRPVTIAWEAVPRVKRYEVSILDPRGSEVYRGVTEQVSLVVSLAPEATYRVAVRSVSRFGVPGDWADPVDLAVKLPAPGREEAELTDRLARKKQLYRELYEARMKFIRDQRKGN